MKASCVSSGMDEREQGRLGGVPVAGEVSATDEKPPQVAPEKALMGDSAGVRRRRRRD